MNRLFTPVSKTPYTLRKLVITFVCSVFLVVLIDHGLSLLLQRITIEPPFILRLQNVQGVEALWKLTDAEVSPIIFTGSSQGQTGFSPHVFDDHVAATTGHSVTSVNVSIWGSVVLIQRDLIQNLFIPSQPRLILYGIEMRAVQDNAQGGLAVSDFQNKALGYAVSSSSSLERDILFWLMKNSFLFSYRDNMREWLTHTREINQLEYSSDAIDDRGFFNDNRIMFRDPSSILNEFTPFQAGENVRQILMDIGMNCRQSGVQCILVNMPIHDLSYQYITKEDESAYLDTLRVAGLLIWDFNTKTCRDFLGDNSFYNLNHLNAAGAQAFSQMVGDRYIEQILGRTFASEAFCSTVIAP
jgi:hypothetical protein